MFSKADLGRSGGLFVTILLPEKEAKRISLPSLTQKPNMADSIIKINRLMFEYSLTAAHNVK